MKATRIHYFYAQDWPIKIWFGFVLLFCVVLAVRASHPTMAAMADWRVLLWLVATVVLALLLGFFMAILCGWLILGPLYYARLLKNGGPFKVGDHVEILYGPHRGRVVRVYSLWQGDGVRVKLSEQEKETFKDVFGGTKLLKARGAESTIDTERNEASVQLREHLEKVLSPDEAIETLVSIARMIWCTLTPLPHHLQSLPLDRECISESFAEWCRIHRRSENECQGTLFWDLQIRDTLKSRAAFDCQSAIRLYLDLCRREGAGVQAEPIAPPEPPLPNSISGGPVCRTLDSLPSSASGGGR